jgi:hypothetical protein
MGCIFSFLLYFQYPISNCHFLDSQHETQKNKAEKKFNNFAETIIIANKHSLQKENNNRLLKALN